ncbi:MAG: hypothetical protein KAJ52_00030 [Sedimentisphaerales bacterium]|nr:hypothetical protein [Sedimentisphaerales bacterium]
MNRLIIKFCFLVFLVVTSTVWAECPLDHLIIGCNEDGVEGTDDDNRLFVDCWQKYRDSGPPEYVNWYYPLHESIFSSYKWRLGEPGLDGFQETTPSAGYTYDPNRCLVGAPDTNYRIIVRCVSMSSGLRVVHKDYPQFTIDEVGESFNHSYIHALRGDPHMHLSYQAVDGDNLFWITWQMYDEMEDPNQYEPSEPFTIIFNREPLAGDLVVDGMVDVYDLVEIGYYWLSDNGSIHNDYYERADADKNGRVNLLDFAMLASNWLDVID